MLTGLRNRIIDSDLPDCVKAILVPFFADTSVLKHLLTDTPLESIKLSNILTAKMQIAILGVTKASKPYTWNELRRDLVAVFDYEHQLSRNKSRSYKITHAQGRNTCTYCNRLYSFTVVHNENVPTKFLARTNDDNRKVRPQLDHWFDKSDYPLLSLNLYNLIPSCAICNASVKGAANFSLATHIHPYLYDKEEPPFKFGLAVNNENNLIIAIDDSKCSLAEKNMIRDLALKEIYEYHGELEGKDILLWRIKNTTDYIENTMKRLENTFRRSHEEVYRMFFGSEYSPENNLNRPFSKFKRDILEYLGIKVF